MATHRHTARTACVHCSGDMEPSHMLGDMRYYVCRPCNAWSIPFPPETTRHAARSAVRCVSSSVGVPYVDEGSEGGV